MDTMRGTFESDGGDLPDDVAGVEASPSGIGQDERRMQVRAYNMWAGMLDNRRFPAIRNLDPAELPDFSPYSVLLDFSTGIENPTITFLGDALAAECGTPTGTLASLADVPSRSLLSRITDHYMQILANQAPIGFEAEFVNQRGLTVLYRGILLPYSSDDETIDFIYGVINWKELDDQSTAEELLLEIDQALDTRAGMQPEPLAAWADGPVADADPLPRPMFGGAVAEPETWPAPAAWDESDTLGAVAGPDMALADWLATAREMAEAASGSEDRTRAALYAAIGHAYDFALAAAEAPDELRELLADAGLTMQERAPLTPVVKLVFGANYDKTRLTEYATALGHAQRVGVPQGTLAEYLRSHEGGLKGVVKEEREFRRQQSGAAARAAGPGKQLLRRLRAMPVRGFDEVAEDGSEFALLMIRRQGGRKLVVGEVPADAGLVQRAARKLMG